MQKVGCANYDVSHCTKHSKRLACWTEKEFCAKLSMTLPLLRIFHFSLSKKGSPSFFISEEEERRTLPGKRGGGFSEAFCKCKFIYDKSRGVYQLHQKPIKAKFTTVSTVVHVLHL